MRTPVGDRWILASDEVAYRTANDANINAPARLLPSGDTYLLLQGRDRELLVEHEDHRNLLWPPRVWPGGLLVDGEIVGTWRRSDTTMTVQPWRDAVENEAQALPLPDIRGRVAVRWMDIT